MSQYFNKDFFKFLTEFIAIIIISLILILVTQSYRDVSKTQTTNVIQTTTNP